MKNLNFISPIKLALICLVMASCSKSDPTPTPPTNKYICVQTTNATSGANLWDIVYEPAGFSSPNLLRSDNFAPTALYQSISSQQKSAYDKTNKIYLVSTGDRIIRYQYGPTAASSIPSLSSPGVFTGGNVQAMEFLGTRLFIIKNGVLQEYDSTTLTPLTTFPSISLGSVGYISNMTSFGTKLYFINNITLQSVDISAATPTLTTVATLSPIAAGVGRYDGLEAFNATTFYAIKNDTSPASSKFIKITSGVETTEITGLPLSSSYTRPSSAYDSQTEFYYAVTYDSTTNSSTIISIDLTPYPVAPLSTTSITTSGKYVFGLQIID